jgi:hypothetical protein
MAIAGSKGVGAREMGDGGWGEFKIQNYQFKIFEF